MKREDHKGTRKSSVVPNIQLVDIQCSMNSGSGKKKPNDLTASVPVPKSDIRRKVVMSRLCMVIICVLCLQQPGILAAVEATDKITTFAGSVSGAYSGDGGPANEAKLMEPEGIAIDEKGVIYIADTGNHVIRRVSLDGIITTIAGTGDPGFSGDEGPATQALLNIPRDVAVDSKGNIYIADYSNQCVRRYGRERFRRGRRAG